MLSAYLDIYMLGVWGAPWKTLLDLTVGVLSACLKDQSIPWLLVQIIAKSRLCAFARLCTLTSIRERGPIA